MITEPSEITLKSATVYWNYNNIDNNLEDFITVDGNRVEFKHGYWNFEDLETKLKNEGVTIVEECVTGKCVVSVNDGTYFKTLGVLLGLNNYTNMTAGSTITSHNMVDVNRGLRSLNVKCNIQGRDHFYWGGVTSKFYRRTRGAPPEKNNVFLRVLMFIFQINTFVATSLVRGRP